MVHQNEKVAIFKNGTPTGSAEQAPAGTLKASRGAAERMRRDMWLVGQAVKTPASHAGNGGSIPPRVTKK